MRQPGESRAVNGQAAEGESGARLSNHRKLMRRGSVITKVSDARRLNCSPYRSATASARRPVSEPRRGYSSAGGQLGFAAVGDDRYARYDHGLGF